MPSCVVKWCKNNTTSQKKCQGITFHRFPTGNEPWKDDWTRIIRNCRGQEDWSASKSSVVCSIHFDQNYLYTTSKGRRRLVTYATRIKLFMSYNLCPSRNECNLSAPTAVRSASYVARPLPLKNTETVSEYYKQMISIITLKSSLTIYMRSFKSLSAKFNNKIIPFHSFK
ncbi:hypothetical protein ABMA27_013067 [Loxostege sticticalis]|uniref:THAP-type domain-containing protein n=1 Tax=Loxostege sticticalis TaxID=481309 RepID=A0ABR3IDY5_LOXSC